MFIKKKVLFPVADHFIINTPEPPPDIGILENENDFLQYYGQDTKLHQTITSSQINSVETEQKNIPQYPSHC
jgi:hypothetical protein